MGRREKEGVNKDRTNVHIKSLFQSRFACQVDLIKVSDGRGENIIVWQNSNAIHTFYIHDRCDSV